MFVDFEDCTAPEEGFEDPPWKTKLPRACDGSLQQSKESRIFAKK